MHGDFAKETDATQHMTTSKLAERYQQLHGQPVRTRHRAQLIGKVAWRIQANAGGDLSERARKRASELANDADVHVMPPTTMIEPPDTGTFEVSRQLHSCKHNDPRIPTPGSAIVREYGHKPVS